MNVRDTEQVAQDFKRAGYTITTKEENADAILINTCSVRDQAEQKALGKMGMMGKYRRHNPHVVYGFMGCMAQSEGNNLFKKIPHLDLVVGTQKYHRVVTYVDQILKKRMARRMDELSTAFEGNTICDIEEEKDSQNTIKDHDQVIDKPTAFVSIMQGCNMSCSYCIVPSTRGRERSRPIIDIVDEVHSLVKKGVKEVTLLGQIVNLYGRTEFPKQNSKSPFVQLLEAVHAIEGIERIRFTSPHPIGYREDLVKAFTYLPKLASHIHFPMQSGSDRVLKLMRRPYKNEKFLKICKAMQQARPDLAITTDIIVGYPGETEADFQDTIQCVKEIGFDNCFVFRYSPRKNTPAAEMTEQHSEALKEERNQILLGIVNEISVAKNNRLVGSVQRVLCEGPSKTNKAKLFGRTTQNKIVIFDGDHHRLIGQFVDIKIDFTTGFSLYGTLI